MTAPLIRIFLRYLAGILVARGLLTAETGGILSADPDVYAVVETAAGLAIAAATEGYYYLARKWGWST